MSQLKMAATSCVYLVISLILIAIVNGGKHDVYKGYTVHGVEIRDRGDLKLLHQLEHSLNLDVWQHGIPGARDAYVMAPAEIADLFLEKLDENLIKHYVHIGNIMEVLEKHDEQISEWKKSRNGRLIPFEDYPRYAEVNAYIESIAQTYPDIVTLVNAGPSYEGRDIKYLKISTSNFTDSSKPVFFMDAMIHAREWVTTPVALYSIHRLVEELRDRDRDLLDELDWIVLPIVNPDGYEYTHTNERLWRQTRSVNLNVSSVCVGVDANRNFDSNFANLGVSNDPCSLVYPGTEAFSEVETSYIRDIMFEHLDRIQIYLNIHSYGNLVLFAYGDGSLPDNAAQVHHVGATMGAAFDVMKLPEALYYVVGNSAGVLYGSSGTARDYGQLVGIPFSYTLELPGLGYEFTVPPSYIAQINEETWNGIAAAARLARIYYRARYNLSLV